MRIGNDAHGQLQLDVYGEVIDAVGACSRGAAAGSTATPHALLGGLGADRLQALARAGRGHLGGSRAAGATTPTRRCCAGSRSTACSQLHDAAACSGLTSTQFRAERDAIARSIETRAATTSGSAATPSTLDGDDLDASLLTLPLMATSTPATRACASTCARDPGSGSAAARLIYRYRSVTTVCRGRGRVRHLRASGRSSAWRAAADLDGATASVRALARLRERRRPVRRGDRSRDRRGARQLPAGVHPRRPDQRGADARGTCRGADAQRGASAARQSGREESRDELARRRLLWGFVGTVVLTA